MNTVEKAKAIRSELKETFKGVKFSVRTKKYSGGSSISISWIDFPTASAVEEITSKYESISRCEYTGEILSGGNTYIHTYNTWSEDMENTIKENLITKYGIEFYNEHIEGYNYYRYARELFETMYQESIKQEIAEPVATTTIEDTKIVLNEELKGIELYFITKPSKEVRVILKENGFKYNGNKKCWYNKQSEKAISFANSLIPTQTIKEDILVDEDLETLLNVEIVEENESILLHENELDIIVNDITISIQNEHITDITMTENNIECTYITKYQENKTCYFYKSNNKERLNQVYNKLMDIFNPCKGFNSFTTDKELLKSEISILENRLNNINSMIEKYTNNDKVRIAYRQIENNAKYALEGAKEILEGLEVEETQELDKYKVIETDINVFLNDIEIGRKKSNILDMDYTETQNIIISKYVILSNNNFDYMCNNLMDDFNFLDGFGGSRATYKGTAQEIDYKEYNNYSLSNLNEAKEKYDFYEDNILITNEDNTKYIVVNPEGYSYCRYVGILTVSEGTRILKQLKGEVKASNLQVIENNNCSTLEVTSNVELINNIGLEVEALEKRLDMVTSAKLKYKIQCQIDSKMKEVAKIIMSDEILYMQFMKETRQ